MPGCYSLPWLGWVHAEAVVLLHSAIATTPEQRRRLPLVLGDTLLPPLTSSAAAVAGRSIRGRALARVRPSLL